MRSPDPPDPARNADEGVPVLVPSPGIGGRSSLTEGGREGATDRRAGVGAFIILCAVTLNVSAFAAGPSTLPGDVPIAQFIQKWHFVPLNALADIGNGIGATQTAIVVALTLLLGSIALHRNRDTAFVLALIVLRAFGSLLKSAFRSPRPTSPTIHLDGTFAGFGYPSGHTYAATCIAGALIVIAARRVPKPAKRRLLYAVAVALPLITGFARVYVGAHWPSDVLGGWLWGTITVVVAWWLSRRLLRRVRPTDRPAAPSG